MLPSLVSGIAEVASSFNFKINEDGKEFLNQMLSVFGEALIIEACRYAVSSEDNIVDYSEIQSATNMLLPKEISKHAVSDGTRAVMAAKMVANYDDMRNDKVEVTQEEMEEAAELCKLNFPLIEMFNALKGRDNDVTVYFRAVVYYSGVLEYLAAEVIEVSSNKAVQGEGITPAIITAAVEEDVELKAIFFPSSDSESTEREVAEASSLLNEILDLLKVERSSLKIASEEDIATLEAKMELPLPAYLRALLKIANGSYSFKSDVYLYPSLADMEEQFFYNRYLPKIYRMNRWIPYLDLDYDFCWEILDVKEGGVILQFDLECDNFWQNGNTDNNVLTFMKRLQLFRDYLLSLENPTISSVKHDKFRDYEKSLGFGAVKMSPHFERKYNYSFNKVDAYEQKPSSAKKARK
jgi:hypothetical protein